ncbi:hypothetical protein [Dyadobacter sp. CY347]|uniref:hypothetical protein n=1 Tax=Dyadobacter sp. CY347 TaxID=2909336 RepID=UPI001F47A10C|nr:hypothetical protein [Dyadobacter sp. CY347]MCF2490489.1 hypothetical protein [Dyadobacter sp. CY347]
MQLHLFKTARKWDSCLLPIDDNTLGLILQFRVRLVRIEPGSRFFMGSTYALGDGFVMDEGRRFTLASWNNREWEAYQREFVRVVQRHWSDKFVLIPNKPWYSPRPGAPLTAAKINCGLSIELVLSDGNAHQTYRIIHPTQPFRSFADPEGRSGLFTHTDVEPEWNTSMTRMGRETHSVSFYQIAVNHEFGHTLGLAHVNGVGNSDWNYGVTLEQRENQLGLGSRLTSTHARPWINRLKSHLIPRTHADSTVHFTGTVDSLQLIEYWDNDWQPPEPTPART